MTGANDEIPELNETERAQWTAASSAVSALAESAYAGTLDADAIDATFSKLRQIPFDHDRLLNAVHVAEDAGEHRDRLIAMLRRIPDGWGRWIGCDAGWYPLITALDAGLAAIAPDYELNQVKEKYGTLRYYAEPPSSDESLRSAFDELIGAAEKRSETICERCGDRGSLCVAARWYKTLCDPCVEALAAGGGSRYRPVTGG